MAAFPMFPNWKGMEPIIQVSALDWESKPRPFGGADTLIILHTCQGQDSLLNMKSRELAQALKTYLLIPWTHDWKYEVVAHQRFKAPQNSENSLFLAPRMLLRATSMTSIIDKVNQNHKNSMEKTEKVENEDKNEHGIATKSIYCYIKGSQWQRNTGKLSC